MKAAINITARFIENANVIAGKNVTSGTAIIRSNVTAGDSVIAQSGKGTIFGGYIHATTSVQAKVIGAPAQVHTEIILGMTGEQQMTAFELDKQMVLLTSLIEELEDVAKSFGRAAENPVPLTEEEQQAYSDVRKSLVLARYRIQKVAEQKENFLREIELESRGRVQVSSLLYPGVVVQIGTALFRTDSEIKGCTLRYDHENSAIIRSGYTRA